MVSLSPVMVGTAIKLDPQLKKLSSHSLAFEKKSSGTKELGRDLDSYSLELREALLSIREAGNGKLESSSYAPLLQECVKNENLVMRVEPVHAHIIKTGFSEDLFLMTLLINVYAKRGMIESAQRVFDSLPNRNVVTWTSLMSGYIHNSQPEFAFSVFKEMLENGGYPTTHTLTIILSSCASLVNIGFGKQVHGYIIKYDLEHDASIGNGLCNLYSKSRSLDMACKAFQRINEKNVISWTALISGCGENENCAMGLEMFVQMLMEGVVPNEVTLMTVLSLCCTMQAVDLGSQFHSLSVKLGYGSILPVTNSIMYLYLKSGCINEAKKLFDKMDNIGLVTWNAMIAGYAGMIPHAEDGVSAYLYGIEALKIFERMGQMGLKPDFYTFSSIVSVCSSLVALEQGEQIHAQMLKTGILCDMVVGTALVNMYNKCGGIDSASKAFIEMSNRTLISWTTMITAFAQHGHSQQALNLFEDMRFIGVRPNKVTFVGVLSACSQSGMVDEALAYYEMMKTDYKINPTIDHVACLTDMFVRLGQIEQAFEFIETTDLTPNEFIWSRLIAGCRSHGKLELGFEAAEKLLELKPKDPENYFLLLNMYVSAGKWKDVSRVREMMRDEDVDKFTDWSWISIKNKVYGFKFGNKKHQSDEVVSLLEGLVDRARGLGYQVEPNLEMDEKDEAAMALTAHHSEKLAVAFGLLNTSNHAQILVIKSVSMCRDCHNLMKLVSTLTSRIIVVRDSKRMHRFSGGQCSCKDFGGFD